MVSFSAYMRGTKKWESEAQEKGMKALQKYLHDSGRLTDMNSIWQSIAWLIQRDHESNEWWLKTVGDQISRLEDQIRKLQENAQSQA